MSDLKQQSGHPKGLYLLFTVEMWERFSFYGMRAIFILYMTKALMLTMDKASDIYGTYTSLVYLTPIAGGFIADRYWGNRRSIFIGGLLMAIAQMMMFVSASVFETPETAIPIMYAALGLLIIGNGFFKPNISSMVGSLYPKNDSRIDSAFTIFYMGINLGSSLAPFVAGGLGDTNDPSDFKWGFLSASIGMIIGTITFQLLKNKYLISPEGTPLGMPVKNIAPTPSITQKQTVNEPLTSKEIQRIAVIFILATFVIAFWAAFEQAGASLTIFADQNTDRYIGFLDWTMPASFFQALNPFFVIILALPFAYIWTTLGKKKIEPSSPLKMSIGLFLLALGFFVIAIGVKGVGSEDKVSMMWLVVMYFLHTCGELALSPIGLSMVNKLSPAKFVSLLMGIWFLSNAVANKLAGVLSALFPVPGKPAPVLLGFYEVTDLYAFFMIFVAMAGGSALILFLIHGQLKKMMHGIN